MYLSSISSRLVLHDTNSWELRKSYGHYEDILQDVSWSEDGNYMLQVNSEGLVNILSPAEHDVLHLEHIPLKDTWSACYHGRGHRNVAIGTKSGKVLLWDTKSKKVTKILPRPTSASCVNFICFNADYTTLASTMSNGKTVIYGMVSHHNMIAKLHRTGNISAIKFHYESISLLGFATDEGDVILRDIASDRNKNYFENVHDSLVSDLTFDLNSQNVLLSSGYDRRMRVYDIRMQNIVSTITTPYCLTSIALNLENQVALGTTSGNILIHDLRNITIPWKILQCHKEEVRKVSYQPGRNKTRPSDVYFFSDTLPIITIEPPSPVSDNRAD